MWPPPLNSTRDKEEGEEFIIQIISRHWPAASLVAASQSPIGRLPPDEASGSRWREEHVRAKAELEKYFLYRLIGAFKSNELHRWCRKGVSVFIYMYIYISCLLHNTNIHTQIAELWRVLQQVGLYILLLAHFFQSKPKKHLCIGRH